MAARDAAVREPHSGPRRGSRLKKALLIGLPILLLLGGGGAAVGLAMVGIVQIPFLPFGHKKHAPLPKDDGRGGPFEPYVALASSLARQADVPPPAKVAPPAPKADTGPGEAKLAGLWAELPPDRLAALVAKWPSAQAGRILALMDDDAVTALLAALPPVRAADVSRAVAAATDESAAKVHTNDQK